MHPIDSVQINFNQEQLLILNICLAFLMFGVALDLRLDNFRDIFRRPKAPLIGLTSQLILLPILTLALIYIFRPPTSLALGMILIASCLLDYFYNFQQCVVSHYQKYLLVIHLLLRKKQ